MDAKKYIFFDIDGTLLDSDNMVPDSTKVALTKAQKNGHEIFINTGRCKNIVPDNILSLGFDGYICSTGCYVEYHDNIVQNAVFSKDQTKRVTDISKENNIAIVMSCANKCVIPTKDLPLYAELLSDGKIKAKDVIGVTDIESIDEIANIPFVQSISPVICDDNVDDYWENHKNICDFIYINSPFDTNTFQKLIGDDIHIEKASFKTPDDFTGEITLANYNKFKGIEVLLDHISANLDDAIAIGDGYNDIDMLINTKLSIAMGNSPKYIKEISNMVSDSIDNNGVFNALKKLQII